jgi:hypothetical protein
MPDSHSFNEGIRTLDDFICRAIPDPSLPVISTGGHTSPFVVGGAYRVRRDFDSGRHHFSAGELVTYIRREPSPFAGASAYIFRDAAGRDRRFDLALEQRVSDWTEFFEPAN